MTSWGGSSSGTSAATPLHVPCGVGPAEPALCSPSAATPPKGPVPPGALGPHRNWHLLHVHDQPYPRFSQAVAAAELGYNVLSVDAFINNLGRGKNLARSKTLTGQINWVWSAVSDYRGHAIFWGYSGVTATVHVCL